MIHESDIFALTRVVSPEEGDHSSLSTSYVLGLDTRDPALPLVNAGDLNLFGYIPRSLLRRIR